MQTGAVTRENTMEVAQKLKRAMPYDPVISPLGVYLKEHKTLIQKKYKVGTK